jgi:hypothetical protein
MNRFLISRIKKWTNTSAAILMVVAVGGADSANAEEQGSATGVKSSISLGDAENAKMLGILEAKRRIETKVGDITASLSKILSQGGVPGFQKFPENCEKWNQLDSYIFFVEKYEIYPGYEKYKIHAHPNPNAVGTFASRNVVAMSYIPREDFFEEDCEQATTEGSWLGPYRNTKTIEQEGTYQISRKSMFYRKIPNTDYIVVGVVIEGGNASETVIERPNRFIANSSKRLQTERSGVESMARVRRKAWKQARRTFSN